METGSVLQVAVGQQPDDNDGGSGGTFVIKQEATGLLSPLVIAGGAGGDYYSKGNAWCHAQLEQYGNGPNNNNNTNLGSSASGTEGGAGFKSDQPNVPPYHPKCFKTGMTGGSLSGQKYYFRKIQKFSIIDFNIKLNFAIQFVSFLEIPLCFNQSVKLNKLLIIVFWMI